MTTANHTHTVPHDGCWVDDGWLVLVVLYISWYLTNVLDERAGTDAQQIIHIQCLIMAAGCACWVDDGTYSVLVAFLMCHPGEVANLVEVSNQVAILLRVVIQARSPIWS